MRRTAFVLMLLLLAGTGRPQAVREEDLSPKYREWLDLTRYIQLPQERDVFLRLSSDRERDLFIEAFWRQRDPTPGTPQNEYREEIISRFSYVNREFGRGTTVPGWQTDRGKIYILLGPPATRERYDGLRGLYPCEAWYYHGDPSKGQPAYFGFLFFKRRGSGDYVLYHQVQDGPAALLVDGQDDDPTAYAVLYQKIKKLAPELAPLAISMVPSEISPDLRPSLRTDAILAEILSAPRRDVSPTYATHFLNYRGVVSTEYLTNYVEVDGLAEVIRHPGFGFDFVHFSLTPKSVSVDYYRPKDKYYCHYSVDVSLRNAGKLIFQYSREFPFYYSPSEEPVVRFNGISLQDTFPVCEGTHELTILLRNSVGKEFGVFEKTIEVRRPDRPGIDWLLLSAGEENASPGQFNPFQISETKLSLAHRQTFLAGDEVGVFFALSGLSEEFWKDAVARVELRSLAGSGPPLRTALLETRRQMFSPVLIMRHGFPASELTPGYYEISVHLVDAVGRLFDSRKAVFVLSPAREVPRPVVIAKAFPLSNAFLFSYILAAQYDNLGRPEHAEAFFARGYALAPEYAPGVLSYADFLVRSGRPERALPLADTLIGGDQFRFQGLLIKGKALMGLKRYEEAIQALREGNAIYDSETSLLNALGVCYMETGQKDLAREVFSASLRLNSEQPEVKKFLMELDK